MAFFPYYNFVYKGERGQKCLKMCLRNILMTPKYMRSNSTTSIDSTCSAHSHSSETQAGIQITTLTLFLTHYMAVKQPPFTRSKWNMGEIYG
jgi:hypothetical protein